MLSAKWFRAPRQLVGLFLVVTLVPILGLVWLSWQMIRQDRAVEDQRTRERCEDAAGSAAIALQRLIAELEEQLSSFANPASGDTQAENVALVAFSPQGIERAVGATLLYYPCLPPVASVPAVTLAVAEKVEFQSRDPLEAIRYYRHLTNANEPATRAGAWLSIGRCYRKLGEYPKALEAYNELEKLDAAPVAGEPAELVARQGRATLFRDWDKRPELLNEASELAVGISRGRWRITRASYRYLAEETSRWLDHWDRAVASPNDLALSDAVASIWSDWKSNGLGGGSAEGQRTLWTHERSVLLLWRALPERLMLLAAGPALLEEQARQALGGIARKDVRFLLEDAEGHAAFGQPVSQSNQRAIRTMAATGLPWTVYVLPSAESVSSRLSTRVRLLLGALALMVLFTLAGGYFITRAISRELAVARLQSDFVAAVSHDFRTPLTTLMQLSEMLVRGRVSTDERRREFYSTLYDESRRLHHLVEGLLNFAQLEAGKARFQLEMLDPSNSVTAVVEEFRQTGASAGHRVELEAHSEGATVRADREALGRVLWNLLDNAVKYSPEQSPVRVEVACMDRRCVISVRDEGIGIPAEEQKEIFGKFVRGEAARNMSVKGTGIGLSMARMIVEGHGGKITVESVPGQGSTFRVVLPLVE